MASSKSTEYVIMLDVLLDMLHDQWLIVYKSSKPEDAKSQDQFTDVILTRSRKKYQAVFLESKTLIHTRTGTSYAGGVYKMTPL